MAGLSVGAAALGHGVAAVTGGRKAGVHALGSAQDQSGWAIIATLALVALRLAISACLALRCSAAAGGRDAGPVIAQAFTLLAVDGEATLFVVGV